MNSLEKRHTGRRGSTHVRRKYSDGFSDTSSGGSYMDETDREVSNLTDRAFRSLCIGEEAIYNDSEISSPTERHKAFAEEPDQKEAVKATCQETFSYGIQYGEAERRNEVASTFQQSCMDVFRDECLSYMSNGSVEATWQHRRSTSRVASLIKAFSSGEGYYSTADTDTALSREKSRDFNNDSWDKSALVCTQKDLPEISSAYQQNFNTGSFQSYKHYSHASAASVVQMHTAASLGKSHKINFKALNSTNFFFHSEFSPFQLWKDYNRFPFKREETSGFVSTSEFPRWYNTPLYKELTAAHRTSSSSSEGRWFNRRKTEDVAVTQRSRSTVIQKASAVEKRCESEITSSCPPWRKNNNFMRNKLPSNRPSTVSPTNEKITRADSSLFYPSRHAYEIQHKVGNVGDNEMSSNMIPFSITHLLTPVIHGRQETETSEILQFAHTPSVPDCPAHSDTDMKSLPDVKQLRDSYKAKASSLLFNIKDNRKRVKSTYSPPKCKSSEITDRSKQPPKLNNLQSRLSDTAVPQMTTQEYSAASDPWELCNLVQQTYDVSLSQSVEHKEHADGSHCNIALSISPSQYEAANYKIPQGDSKGNSLHPNKLSNRESREYGFSPHMHLAQNKTTKHSEDHIYKLSRTLSPRRPEMETVLSKAHPPVHTAQRSEKQTLSRREDVHYNIKEENKFVRKPSFGCTNNAEETLFCENPAPTNITNKKNIDNSEIKNVLPFKGEIAALIEMDKQRKANAKQYLPLAIDSYTMGKETYINKMNENIKQGRLTKEEEMKATEISSQKYPQIGFRNNPVQDHPTNTLAVSQNVREFQNPLNITTSPTKEANFCKGPENAHNKAEVCLQRDNDYPGSDITPEKDYRQRTHFSLLQEEKHKNEGSVAYQPYNYEPNKQWYIGSQNKQTKDKVSPPRQLQQTEKKSDKSGETNYSLSEASCIQHQSVKTTAQRTVITEDKPRTEDLKPNNSVSPKESYAKKLEDTNLDINKQNIQSTELNNKSSQIREDRFNINDILSIRDNEQAKRIRENKHSFSASEAAKLENQPSFTSDITEDKEAKRKTSKMKEQGQNPCYKLEKTNPASAYIRKESHNPSEGLVNVGTGLKEKSGKDTLMNNENDRITSKALFSYRERGQTKQEILTSKLKAHAQKEISAIKEKGLSKQSIPSRNPIKQNTVHEKGQFNQLSLKKEITAEKLDHLFQDITYSSVTSYKESRNQDNNGPKYESLMEQDMQLPKGTTVTQGEATHSGKNTEAAKDDKLIINEKENGQLQDKTDTVVKTGEFQDIPESYQPQPLIQSTENHFNCGLGNPEEQCTNASALEDIAVLNKSLSRSPPLISLNKEISVVKTDETATHQPMVNNKNKTEYLTCAPMGNDSSRGDLSGKIVPCKLTPCNSLQHAKYLDYSINKTSKLLSNVEVDKHTVSSDRTHQKCTNLKVLVEETAREKRSTREENLHYENTGKEPPTTEPSEEITKTNTRQVSPQSDLTKLKNLNLPVDPTVESTHTETGLPEHSTTKDKENEANCIDVKSPEIINLVYGEHIPETKEKSTQKESEQWAKQDIKLQADSTAKPNKDSLIWQLHHSDTPKLKACENAHTNKGSENQTISNSNKQECIQTLSAGVNECPLLKEPKENEHKAFHPEKNEIQQNVCHSKQKISSATERKSQQIQETQSRHSENQSMDSENQSIQSENRTQMEKDTNHQAINAPNEKNEDESIEANSNSSLKPTETEHDESQERSNMQNDTINNTNQKENYHSVNSVDIISPVPDGHIIHIPSKKDEEPVDEPVIYSIHVSSKSETVSEDEPVIFTICVSSMADTPNTNNIANHNRHSSGQEQQSVEGVERGEIPGNIKEETVNGTFECKASEIKKEKVLLDNKKAGKENVVGKYSSPATKDKNDCYSVVDNISSSYEGLLEKYGLPSGDNIHLKSGQKEQDKMQEKEEKGPINDPLQKVQKTPGGDDHTANADYIKRHHQESRKKSQVPEFLKPSEENGEQHVTHLTEEKQITASEESSQTAGGVMSTSEKNIKTEKQGILVKQKASISNVVPVCECSQDTMSTTAQKTDVTNDNDGEQLEDKEKVKQKVQVMDSARHTVKETENDYGVNKKADIIVMKNMTDNQKTTNTSNSATVIDDHSYEDLCKHTPDAAPDHKRQKTAEAVKKIYSVQEECERDSIKVEILNTDTALTKDSKSSQNVVGAKNVGKNSLGEQEEIEFKIRREAKGKRDIILQNGNPTFTNVQTVKESQNVLEDQIKKLSTASKTDQILVKNLNMSFEEKNMPKMELELNKNIVKIQEKHLAQNEQMKLDSTSAGCVVLPKNPNENVQSRLAKVTVQKSPSTVDSTEDDTKRLDNQKWKEESIPTQGKNIKNEITPVNNNDTRETASSLIKDRNATECESNKNDNIVKDLIDQPQHKKEDNFKKVATDKVGQIKSKAHGLMVKDNSNIRGEMENSGENSQVKHDDRINVYQYYPGKGFLPETKGNKYNEPSSIVSYNHDAVLKKKDCTIAKPDIIEREKKTTRPEISALADYARLRVISAEDDTTSEKELLQKMDTHHKYNLFGVEPQKGLQRNLPTPLGSAEVNTKKTYENQSQITKPLQIQERDNPSFQRSRITEEMLERYNEHISMGEITPHSKLSSMTRSSDGRLFGFKETGSTRGKTLTNQTQPNKSLNEQLSGYPKYHGIHQSQDHQVTHSLLSQDKVNYGALSRLTQPVNSKMQNVYSHVKNPESLAQTSVGSQHNKKSIQTGNQKNVISQETNGGEKMEELQYYTVNARESEPKPKDLPEMLPVSHKTILKKEGAEISVAKARSNSSSPAMGKPFMFKVKDNTLRTTSVTKTVKPHFRRSFSEEFRIGSPREMWKCSEKDEPEYNHELDLKEPACLPVQHEPAVASHRLSRLREIRSQSGLSSAEVTATEPKSYLRRSQLAEDDDNRSVVSTLSEDVESSAASTIITTDSIASHAFDNEHIRYTNARPASACFVRPESVCYERPESSCSDVMRALGKPPSVPPKTEKALRRAKKLTTRRIKKTETTTPDSQGQVETKHIQNASTLRSSPLEPVSSHHTLQASPPISHYHVKPNFAPPAPSIVAHPFPVTQRKLLQDPNSGQYFMVDMPVQVKPKMFFDPATGKYVQLNVRQQPQSNVSQPPSVEVLNQPYIVYPGFLPMPVSSLPSLRSSSQMSAPATFMEVPNTVEANSGVQRQSNYNTNAQLYNEPVYRTHEQTGSESVCSENNVDCTQRKTDIITMSELEDFAMEST